MSYCNPIDLLSYGARELAELVAVDGNVVDPDLLRLTIDDGDRSAYTQQERDDADEALLALEVACADADLEIDGYLAGRYPLPIQQAPGRLVQVAKRIARYNLYSTTAPEQIASRYRDTVNWLKSVEAGASNVPGLDDATTTTGTAGSAQADPAPRTWDSSSLADY